MPRCAISFEANPHPIRVLPTARLDASITLAPDTRYQSLNKFNQTLESNQYQHCATTSSAEQATIASTTQTKLARNTLALVTARTA